ncbi:AraC family transcriptional regulator [Paenibacillus qinlingensis]|uniref:AraC family transcriptional regulator n=1 Tax=Paenibacillus qinlingensis TaxID=1837343 RepID=UPI0015650CD6|nr:AraC family transcriptional regulator [Paenibacillus qinlingensis]NQX63580.1 AraC family transcriptional regulator [Paenibacillus qinlingensis]
MFILYPDSQRLEFSFQPSWIRHMLKPHDFSFGPVRNPIPVFWLILDGIRTIQIEEEHHIVRRGDLIVFPPGVPYQLHAEQSGAPVSYLSLSCMIKLGPFKFHESHPFPMITTLTDSEAITRLSELWMTAVVLFEQFVTTLQRHIDANEDKQMQLTVSLGLLRVQGAVQQWFALLMELLLPQLPNQLPTIDPRIVKVCAYIQEHAHESLSLEKLAAHVYLSASHFSYLFRKEMGQPPAQYLRNHRIQISEELLVQTSLSINEISRRAGYNELSEFSRAFRNVAGISPQAYRKQMRLTDY